MTSSTASAPARISFGRVAEWVWPVALLVAAWEALARARDSIFLPPPSEVLRRVWDGYIAGSGPDGYALFVDHLIPSLGRMFAGYWLAVVLGVAGGVLFGLSRTAREYVQPLLDFGRAVPPPMLLGIFLIVFGVEDLPKILLIAFGSVWPILFNTMDGVAGVSQVKLDAAAIHGSRGADRIRRVVLPGASPSMFAGFRISLSIALILMVITEFVAAKNGLGYTLLRSTRSFDYVEMWAALSVVAVLGVILNAVLVTVERRLLAWHAQDGARV